MKGKLRKIEDLMKKEENTGRRKVIARKGRRKESEKGIQEGEQSIRKFMITGQKISTPKRKLLEGNGEEENIETGSERKRRKLQTGKDFGKKDGGTVKGLLQYFDKEYGRKEGPPNIGLEKEKEENEKEKEGTQRSNWKGVFLSSGKDFKGSQLKEPINDTFLKTSIEIPTVKDEIRPIFPKLRPSKSENNKIGTIPPNDGQFKDKDEKLAYTFTFRKLRKSQLIKRFGDQ